jgi:rsbT co-antagonist protein RsbR
MPAKPNAVRELIIDRRPQLLAAWLQCLREGRSQDAHIVADETDRQAAALLEQIAAALARDERIELDGEAWQPARRYLEEMSRIRVQQGFSSEQTASFVFSLKQPMFTLLREQFGQQPEALADAVWAATELVDAVGLCTISAYQRTREDVIARQQQEMLELSTPVVKLWDGILALPMIGTLDSARTQIVMESLLRRIVETGSEIAIIDITGVPTVDTLVAQHLLKTVTAIRLMGAECIISGVRPQIAQTIVHLGIDLRGVQTKASLADALSSALRHLGVDAGRAQAH